MAMMSSVNGSLPWDNGVMTTTARFFSTRENRLIGSLSDWLLDNVDFDEVKAIEDPADRRMVMMHWIQRWLWTRTATIETADLAESSMAVYEWERKAAERAGDTIHVITDGHITDMTTDDFIRSITL